MHATKDQLSKMHKVITTAARTAIGNYCLYKSVDYILNKCKWARINVLIMYASLKLLYNIIKEKEPKSIYNLFKMTEQVA